MASLIGSIPDLITSILGVALSDPLSALLVAVGSAFFGISFLAIGYLSLGAAIDFVTPDFSSRGPPRQAR